jgi:hypothetical protein
MNDKDLPIVDSFYSGLQKVIENEDKIDDLASQVIDEALNQNKPRATFGKVNNMLYGLDLFY